MESIADAFILNMTSDAKVRKIVSKIRRLGKQRTPPPSMSRYLSVASKEDLEDDSLPPLPFTVFLITGTAGAGKSTCITALHQNLNCLITGATTVAAQNLSRLTKSHCPTIFNAFGFKSRHVNMVLPHVKVTGRAAGVAGSQKSHLKRYWPVIKDITDEFTKNKQCGKYSFITGKNTEIYFKMGAPNLWSTNIIVIDEAGTLSAYLLTAVVYFYWLFNSWLDTPLYRAGMLPCIVCVGSPTQTNSFESTFNHALQRYVISRSDDIFTFLISNEAIKRELSISENWALFINNKRCLSAEFGHMLKTLEYSLPMTDDVMNYIDRFVVPLAKILDPFEYVGWTRLFMSHQEVKSFIVSLHSALATCHDSDSSILFTCPIICEVRLKEFDKYKAAARVCAALTPLQWLEKNLNRLSNYSQFIDQDMVASTTEITEKCLRVTYQTKFVKDSAVSLNGKTKICLFGFSGTYKQFRDVIENDSFLDTHSGDRPEFIFNFLNQLLYNGMYSFYVAATEEHNSELIRELNNLENLLPSLLPEQLEAAYSDCTVGGAEEQHQQHEDAFYRAVLKPPILGSSSIQSLTSYYLAVKEYFLRRLRIAKKFLGPNFETRFFHCFTTNIRIRSGVEFISNDGEIRGLLDYVTTVGHFTLRGYTSARINFNSFNTTDEFTCDLGTLMPFLVVRDETGFVACLEKNITRMTEKIDDEDTESYHVCSVADYGVSSKLAMTIVKSQGISLEKVAISFGSHRNVKKSHVYVAISRTTNPDYLVMDRNPLLNVTTVSENTDPSKHILQAISNPETLLVY